MSVLNYCLFEKKTKSFEKHPLTGDVIHYQAWGVILDARADEPELSVVYRSAPGVLHRERLAREEIDVIPTSQAEWRQIYELILWRESDQGVDRAPDGARLH